jgi:hypothetical protein
MKSYLTGGIALLSIDSLVSARNLSNKNLLQLNSHLNLASASHEPDEYNDNISNSNTDDMFAFSQIIAEGDKVSVVTKELEKDMESQTKSQDED